MSYLRQSTVATIKFGPFLDETDGKTIEDGLSILYTDVRLSKNNGADMVPKNSSVAPTHDELGFYNVVLDQTDTTTAGILLVAVHKAGALPVFQYFMVLPSNIYDSFYSTDKLEVDVVSVDTAGLADFFGVDSGMTYATSTAGSVVKEIADNAGGSALTEAGIADAVWDEAAGDHETLGSFGETVSVSIKNQVFDNGQSIANIWATLTSSLTTAGSIGKLLVDNVNATISSRSSHSANDITGGTTVASAETNIRGGTDTLNTLSGQLDTAQADLDSPAQYQANVASLAIEANVEGHVTTALNTYDPPTKSELDSGFAGLNDFDPDTDDVSVRELLVTALADLFNTNSGTTYASAVAGSAVKEIADNAGGSALSEAGIADAVWDELRTGHTAGGSFGEGVNVIQLLQAAIADLFNTDSGDDYDTAVAGSLVKEVADNAGGSSLTVADIADGVWDELRTGHTDVGSFGEGVNVIQMLQAAIADLFNTNSGETYASSVAGSLVQEIADNAGGSSLTVDDIADGVWNELKSGHVGAGSFGEEVQAHSLSTELTSLAIEANVEGHVTSALNTYDPPTKGEMDTAHNLLATEAKQDTAQTDLDNPSQYQANVASLAIEANVEGHATSALNTYDPPTKTEMDTGFSGLNDFDPATDDVSVREFLASALADLFNTDSGDDYDTAVVGSVVKEIADNSGGSALSLDDIADAIWDEARSGHVAGGTFGEGVNVIQLLQAAIADLFNTNSGDDYDTAVAGSLVKEIADNSGGSALSLDDIADAVWDELKAGHVGAGSLGQEIQSHALSSEISTVDTVVDAIKLKTDNLPADPASETNVNANETKINAIDTVVDAIKVVTDNIPNAGVLNDITAADVWGYIIESTLSAKHAIQALFAVTSGKASGAGTPTLSFRDYADSKDRLVATVDTEDGDRTAQTWNFD